MADFKPHIGKNVIETLTLGMYEDARFIFREYIQNAADQIDEAVELEILNSRADGKIDIEIDDQNRRITIIDNATGIKAENVLNFLGDVAASTKDPDARKGFRGIGRLGGLGYCDKLKFETSYKGESVKSEIAMDAKLLKRMIADKRYVEDASTLIRFITMIGPPETAPSESHYFKVTLENVSNDELLNEDNVREYLSMVAPVPFKDDFGHGDIFFKDTIHEYFKSKYVSMDEYNVQLQEDKIYKAYKTYILDNDGNKIDDIEIINVNFHNIYNTKGELMAIIWYGISNKLNFQLKSSNIERGIRLRKGNIGIGSELTLSGLFSQERQNLNYIGEVHALSPEFIPNARRDYFNENQTSKSLESKLQSFFVNLGTLTYNTSILYNRKKDIEEYQEAIEDFQEKSDNNQFTPRLEDEAKEKLRKKEKKAIKSKKAVEKIKAKSLNNKDLKDVYKNIIGNTDLAVPLIEDVISQDKKALPLTEMSKLSPNEKEIVLEIFRIIEKNLPLQNAEMLKKKISERYN